MTWVLVLGLTVPLRTVTALFRSAARPLDAKLSRTAVVLLLRTTTTGIVWEDRKFP